MYSNTSWSEPDEEMIEAQMKPIRESWKAQEITAERSRLERDVIEAAKEWKRLNFDTKVADQDELAEMEADLALGEAAAALENFNSEHPSDV